MSGIQGSQRLESALSASLLTSTSLKKYESCLGRDDSDVDSRRKVCFKCGVEKPLCEFYRHSMMADGRLGKCKECTKKDVNEHRETNLDSIREYDRRRAKTEKRKLLHAQVVEDYRRKCPERAKAVQDVNNAIRDGKVKRKSRCEVCGKTGRLEKHHPDYDQPLLVVFLCPACHRRLHHGRFELIDHRRPCAQGRI